MISLKIENRDFSQLAEQITWSGDTRQVSRKLVFTIAQRTSDRFLPEITISEGDFVMMENNGEVLFGGKIFDVEKSSRSNPFTYTAFDFMFYVQNNEISRIIDSGNRNHFVYWAKQVPGVGGAKCLGAEICGPGKVKVIVLSDQYGDVCCKGELQTP